MLLVVVVFVVVVFWLFVFFFFFSSSSSCECLPLASFVIIFLSLLFFVLPFSLTPLYSLYILTLYLYVCLACVYDDELMLNVLRCQLTY